MAPLEEFDKVFPIKAEVECFAVFHYDTACESDLTVKVNIPFKGPARKTLIYGRISNAVMGYDCPARRRSSHSL